MRQISAAVAAFLAILAMLPGRAAAEWPDKPVRIIVAYSAGGANDLLGRVFADQLSKTFGQQFFVENRTGGSGLIGSHLHVRDFRVLSIMAGDHQVAAEFVIEADIPSTGGHYRDEEMHLWTFNAEGKVTRLRHYTDTAKHIRAAGRA